MTEPSRYGEPSPDSADDGRSRRLGMLAIPLFFFAVIAGVFYFALQSGDPSRLPSTLIGKPVPQFSLPGIDGLRKQGQPVPGFSTADFGAGPVRIMNVWASWCGPCRDEHPFVTALSEELRLPVYGLNTKDKPGDARRFLGRYGNPYTAVGADRSGRTTIDWGVYGVPETFVIDQEGRIVMRHVGPITPRDYEQKLKPLIAKLNGKPAS